jgi:hypothetical protein
MSLKGLTQDIDVLRSSYWDMITQASAGRKLLLVEGDDDKRVVEQLLEAVTPFWTTKVHVGAAGDRDKVLRKLEAKPDWFGLVDRDVWDDAKVAEKKAQLPNLEVTRGWCIENHFCHPADVESALALDQGTIEAEIDQVLDGWIRYGSIWWTLQRVREDIAAKLPSSKLGHPIEAPCDLDQDARALRQGLQGYQALFGARTVDALIEEIRARKREVDALPARDRIEQGLHGKHLFKEVIARALSRVRGQRNADDWRDHVAGQWQARWPAYLVAFAQRLVA